MVEPEQNHAARSSFAAYVLKDWEYHSIHHLRLSVATCQIASFRAAFDLAGTSASFQAAFDLAGTSASFRDASGPAETFSDPDEETFAGPAEAFADPAEAFAGPAEAFAGPAEAFADPAAAFADRAEASASFQDASALAEQLQVDSAVATAAECYPAVEVVSE